MFSWICPQCGRDVPPSKTDCPYCAEQAAALAAAGQIPAGHPPEQQQAAPWQQPAPGYAAPPNWPQQPPPHYVQPPQAPPPYAPPPYAPQQQYPQQPPSGQHPAPPPYAQPQPHSGPHAWAPPPARSGPPTWAVALGFAAVLLLVGGGIWYFLLRSDAGPSSAKTTSANSTSAAAAASAGSAKGATANPYQKYVEVVGVRMYQQDKKPMVKFVVVNHSTAGIDNLAANVRLWASTSRSEEDSVGSFSFKLPELGANSSKDMTEALKTKMKIYELPDWQNTTAQVEITSPAQ